MRTLSVREVASALGLTKRAVMYRLENGKLKGTRVSNSYGQDEWRVYPNKEIMQAVQAKGGLLEPGGQLNFNPSDVVDSVIVEELDDVDEAAVPDEAQPEEGKARDFERLLEVLREQFAPDMIAEKIVRPLMEKIEAQQEVIFDQRQELSDKDRQLKLLPDLQKQAEERAKALELEHVEKEALKKQVMALQDQLQVAQRPWWKKMLQPGTQNQQQ